jgi:hypothetical protein
MPVPDWFQRWWDKDYSWDGLAKMYWHHEHEDETLQDYWVRSVSENDLILFAGRWWSRYHLPLHDLEGNPSGKDGHSGDVSARWSTQDTDSLHDDLIARAEVGVDEGAHRVPLDGIVTAGYISFAERQIRALFSGAIFAGNVYFNRAMFSGDASFSGATFDAHADFNSATFSGHAYFEGARFNANAEFKRVLFSKKTDFQGTIFLGTASFSGATFSGQASFPRATFARYAEFQSATFLGHADFASAIFSGDADFGSVTFSGNVHFGNVTFLGGCGF